MSGPASSPLLTPSLCCLPVSPVIAPLEEGGRYCRCGPGEWPVKGCWNTPCPCCLFSCFHLPSEKGTGMASQKPGSSSLCMCHGRVSHRQDPHYSFLQEPVQSYCFTSAWNCLKVLHWQLSPLGKHIKLANKSL